MNIQKSVASQHTNNNLGEKEILEKSSLQIQSSKNRRRKLQRDENTSTMKTFKTTLKNFT